MNTNERKSSKGSCKQRGITVAESNSIRRLYERHSGGTTLKVK